MRLGFQYRADRWQALPVAGVACGWFVSLAVPAPPCGGWWCGVGLLFEIWIVDASILWAPTYVWGSACLLHAHIVIVVWVCCCSFVVCARPSFFWGGCVCASRVSSAWFVWVVGVGGVCDKL